MVQGNELLQEAFGNPTIAFERKLRVLEDLVARTKVRQTTGNFLRLLLKNHRLMALPEINQKLAELLDERKGVVGAHVVSARAVPESIREALKKKLMAATGKDIRLSFATDESLIGGLVARIGSTIYDGSIRNQLQLLEEKLASE
jgi:F-type H+-transporting ATPase subunit delta